MATFARLAPQLCAALLEFHRQGTILVGLCPSSFLWDASREHVTLADAVFARPIAPGTEPRDPVWQASPHLRYAAPEVIGRAEMPVDVRADVYALGGVLYELLSGRPAFDALDPSELIQCHLAKRPTPLLELDPTLPTGVTELVMKALAKTPFERFESLSSFEAELTAELAGMPQSHERRSVIRLRQPRLGAQFYGHAHALDVLRGKFRRTRSSAELVIIEGDAGVGKTMLLDRLRQELAHGLFCRGRFASRDQPASPLQAWTTALRSLADATLIKSTAEVEKCRLHVSSLLGESAALISGLVPEWGLILAPPDPAAAAGAEVGTGPRWTCSSSCSPLRTRST
jgi:hypothetical protein